MGPVTIHAHRHEQRHQDHPATDTKSPGKKTGREADQDEFPGLYRPTLDHGVRLGVSDFPAGLP